MRKWVKIRGGGHCRKVYVDAVNVQTMAPGDLCRGMGGRCIMIMAFSLSDMQFCINNNSFVHQCFRRGSKGYLGDMWFLQWQHGRRKRTGKYRKHVMQVRHVSRDLTQ